MNPFPMQKIPFHSTNRLPLSLLALALMLVPKGLLAQYSVALIPDSLKENADAVIRKNDHTIYVRDDRRADIRVDRVITLMNRQADNLATLYVAYNNFDKVGEISGEVYDASGALVRKLKSKEIQDQSAGGSSFASDTRVKVVSLRHDRYPYTVHFSYSSSIKGLFTFPSWTPQEEEGIAVQQAKLQVIAETGQKIRHKTLNIADAPTVSEVDKTTHYVWEVGPRPAIEREPSGPPWREYAPLVYLAPVDFEIEGYQGSTRTWSDFGKFYHALNVDRGQLPPALAQEVEQLTAGLTTNREKIQAIYGYMQQNTRYVSIQLGIGGWQSFDAAYVYTNGYGDCKALSNYVKSMLAAVDITAYPVLIRAGDYAEDILPDYSGNQFNHAIVCVPNAGDTVWLECTVNNFPAGYLGQFTEDRYALLVTPEGGKLIRTPSSQPEANLQQRHATVQLDKQGNAAVQVVVTATGYQQDNLREGIDRYAEREKEQWLRKTIEARSFELTKYAFEGPVEAEIPAYRYTYELQATNWAAASGSRFFLAPNQLQRSSYLPEKIESRRQPVVTKYPYWDTDTVEYALPEGYVIESMPDMPLQIDSEFGSYEADIDFRPEAGKLIYTRSLRMRKVRRPAAEYEAYREFLREVMKADKMQVVLSGKS